MDGSSRIWASMPHPMAGADVFQYAGHDRVRPGVVTVGGEPVPFKMLVVSDGKQQSRVKGVLLYDTPMYV